MKKGSMAVQRVKAEKRSNDCSTDSPVKKIKKTHRSGGAQKIVKLEIDGIEKTLENLVVKKSHVLKCVDAILKLADKNTKKNAFLSDSSKIYLQINCIKIGNVPQRYLRIHLPHGMVGPDDDVALIVPDISKGRRQDYEKSIDHWETILRDNNVTGVKDIIPMNKIKTEYSQYEMQRKLARLYDFFLVDGKIAGHMSHLLGKAFRRISIPPVPIKLGRYNLKKEIETGLKKTSLRIHGNGNSHTVQIAASFMSRKKIAENVIAVCKELEKLYPGGLNNIRSILIKGENTLAIPIYYSLRNKNQVNVPVMLPKRPKAFKTVEGELSTLEGDVTVKVTPTGSVEVIKREKSSDEMDEGVTATEEKKVKLDDMKKEKKPKKEKLDVTVRAPPVVDNIDIVKKEKSNDKIQATVTKKTPNKNVKVEKEEGDLTSQAKKTDNVKIIKKKKSSDKIEVAAPTQVEKKNVKTKKKESDITVKAVKVQDININKKKKKQDKIKAEPEIASENINVKVKKEKGVTMKKLKGITMKNEKEMKEKTR